MPPLVIFAEGIYLVTLVPIVIAAYNCEGYLAQSLQSVCSRTLQGLEVIVVDDGSNGAIRD
jgi:cellulose synthase/poly-beta-1,6-N-acetylglucosamine synthase-like glycosyltransferase